MGDAGVPGNADRAGENGQPSRSLEERVARLELELAALQSKLGSERPAARTSAAPAPAVIAARLPVAAESEAVPAAEVWVRTAKQEPASAAGAAMESFENRLGSQIFNRTAIVSLLIGAAYGMKLAVDRGWLGPAPRVILGLVAGAGLVVWSERFRRNGFAVFSYSLKAVGSGVLYLSLWAAFQRFHLLPAGAALAPMVLVTAWNAYMAWVQDSELLAAYALTGGFATPLLVSTGGNHEIFLFSYLLAIDVATAALVRLKTWPQLLVGAFPVTVLFFIGWYSSYYDASDLETTSIFIVLFGAAFGGVPVGRIAAAQAVRFASQATLVEDILLPMANAAFVALAGYSVLQDAGHHAWLPWLMLVLAAVYLGLMRAPQTRTAEAIHLSLAVVFLTIAIPLKASGAWITVSWLVEGAALVWVAARLAATKDGHPPDAGAGLASRVLRPLALSSLLLGFCGIVLHTLAWASVSELPLLNKGTGTALVGIALFALAAWIALGSGLDDEEESGRSALGRGGIAATTFVLSGITAFLLTVRELDWSWSGPSLHPPFQTADFTTALLGLAVFAGLVWTSLHIAKDRPAESFWLSFAGASTIAFNLIAVLTGVREIAAIWSAPAMTEEQGLQQALAISGFLMLYGAALLALGFWKRSGFLRWQALVLLVLSIFKTFLYDMRNLSQGYRVVSLLGLGTLLMAISFAYQKDWLSLREPAATKDSDGPEGAR